MNFLMVLMLFSAPTFACESAKLYFEGTAFEKKSLQIEGDKIYFFRGSAVETTMSWYPRKKRWCYLDTQPSTERPREGCLSRVSIDGKKQLTVSGKAVKVFAMRDEKQRPVATVSVLNNLLTVNFIGNDKKPLGKRVVFKSVKKDNADLLEAKAWNCPNPKFLSCAGAEVTSVISFDADTALIPKIKMAELSKRLGHYRLSCEGLIESTLEKN